MHFSVSSFYDSFTRRNAVPDYEWLMPACEKMVASPVSRGLDPDRIQWHMSRRIFTLVHPYIVNARDGRQTKAIKKDEHVHLLGYPVYLDSNLGNEFWLGYPKEQECHS